MGNGFRAFSNPSSFFLKDVKVLETDKKVAPKMDGATLSFSRTGAKLGAVLINGTYIWNSQSGTSVFYFKVSTLLGQRLIQLTLFIRDYYSLTIMITNFIVNIILIILIWYVIFNAFFTGKLLKVLAMTTLGVEFVVFSPELDYIASPDLKDKEDVKVSSRYVLILFFQA